MTKIIGVVSGKGGVGKTTTAINLGTAFSAFGKDVIVMDANLTTPNISVHLGAPLVPVTLNDVLRGVKPIHEAIYQHPSGIKVIPSSISIEELKYLNADKLAAVLVDLIGKTEYVIMDASAGLSEDTLAVIKAADEVIVVTNPELPAVTDALKTIKIAERMGTKILGVVINKARYDEFDLDVKTIQTILEYPVLGVIPDDRAARAALSAKQPMVHSHADAPASKEFKRVAARLLGEHFEEKLEKDEKKGLFDYLLKVLGLRK